MKIDLYPDRTSLQDNYTQKHHNYQAIMTELCRDIEATLGDMDTRVNIRGRVKSFESYFEKLLKRLEQHRCRGVMEPIHDIIAVRVVCPFLENVNQVEKLLRAAYTIRDVDYKGEQHTIGEFGYKCIHIVIDIPEQIRKCLKFSDIETIEVQISTILQDAWAEVEHELIYKSRIAPLDTPLRRKLAALNATLSLSDITFQEIRDYQHKLHKELNKRRQSFSSEHTIKSSPGNCNIDESCYNISESEVDDRNSTLTVRSMDELLVEALHAHNRKEYETAIEHYTRILMSSIEAWLRAIVLIHRGIAYFCQARYQQALQDFTAATNCEPGNGKAFYHLGTVHKVLGNNDDAVRYLKQSVELNPHRLEALMELANVFFEMGDYSTVLEYCEKVLKINPDMQSALELHSATLAQKTEVGG